MSVKCEEYNQVSVISVDGDLNVDSGATLRKTAEERIDQRHIVDFVVDLEKTPIVDSEGLEALVWLKRRCEELFGQVRLAAPDDNIRKILEITRLSHRFECHPDLASALKTIR